MTFLAKCTTRHRFDAVHRQNFGNTAKPINIAQVNNFNFEIMNLFRYFYEGGPLFMSILTITGVAMIFFAVKSGIDIYARKNYSGRGINYILMFGSLSFILGLLAQAIGMFQAFEAIQQIGDISPALVAGGLQVSMIAPLYGVFFFIISIPVWVFFREKVKRRK